MPGNDYTPQAWLGTQQLVEHFAGETLVVLDGNSIDAPADWPAFSDVRMLINGRSAFGSNVQSMSTLINAKTVSAGGPGDFDMSIGVDDLIRVTSASPFTLLASSGLWGFPTTEITATLSAGTYTALASNQWTRGAFAGPQGDLRLQLPGGAGWVAFVYLADGTHDGVPQALTHALDMGSYDPEARALDNFAQLCVSGTGNVNGARLALNAAGRVVLAVDNGYADPTLDTDFLQWLGFDGTEVFARVAGSGVAMKEATATNLPAGLAPLHRPVRLDPHLYSEGNAVIMSDAHVDRSHVYTVVGYDMHFTPMGRTATNPTAMQLIRGFYATLWKSQFITVWQNRLESRQAAAESAGYTDTHTGEWDLGVGFMRLVVHPVYGEQLLALQNARSYKLYQAVTIPCLPYVRRG